LAVEAGTYKAAAARVLLTAPNKTRWPWSFSR